MIIKKLSKTYALPEARDCREQLLNLYKVEVAMYKPVASHPRPQLWITLDMLLLYDHKNL